MKILILHTPKGGSGKSTLAREIATMASRSGQKAVLADLDPQGTTAGWYQRRKNPEPALVDLGTPLQTGKISGLAHGGVDLLVIDTPPAQPTFLPTLLGSSDMVLVPVRPTPDDLLAAAPIARSLARHPKWAFVLSQGTAPDPASRERRPPARGPGASGARPDHIPRRLPGGRHRWQCRG